jgi:rubrerythrin
MKEPIPPVFPEFAARSIDEILSLAHALERQAASRYELFARCMRQVGHASLADVFEALAAEERRHIESVERLADNLLARSPAADIADWIIPETFGPDEAGKPTELTVYEVLAIAVRSEERAFAFWTYVAAMALGDEVREQARSMAHQELLHAAKLRHERRVAYRTLTRQAPPPPQEDTPALAYIRDVWREARRLEGQAAESLSEIAAKLTRIRDLESAALVQGIAENMRIIVGGADDPPSIVKQDDAVAGAVGPEDRARLLFEAAGVIDRLVEAYARMLGSSSEAAITAEIQKFATPALDRLTRLNGRLYEIEPALRELISDP